MKKSVSFAALGGALLYVVTSALPASAIECRGQDQWNSAADGWISSPYCEDKLVAYVSGYPFEGPYGVRKNPSVKAYACRFAGSDIRIRDICAGHLPEDYGPRR